MRSGRGASATWLQGVGSQSAHCPRACNCLHVLQALEDCLATALPVEVGFKGSCLGVTQRLASAVLIVVPSPDRYPPALVSSTITIPAKKYKKGHYLGCFFENLKSWRVPEPIEESVDDRGKSRLDKRGQGSMEGARGHWHTAEACFWVQKPSFLSRS